MALVTIRRSPSVQAPRKTNDAEINDDDINNRVSKSLNECYFANKGAALVLGGSDQECDRRRSPARAQPQPDIQHHLQSMFCLLRTEETLKMAVKLESAHPGRTRYLVVVCRGDEAALLGIDCNELTTVGLVLRVLADTSIKLDGDGGFSVCVCTQQHIFKPVSVQAMWSALQTLHRASGRAREMNHFAGGTSHAWCSYYEEHVDSDRSCLNEWHAMDCIESRRPPSPDSIRHKPRERDETERVIRCKLKEIMMSVDLDEVTSKAIRGRLENDLNMDLAEYKSFIDHEMLIILGQMDSPTEIFDHVYLGSEWNASNLEELQRNGVRHILNVTREIDNFFPGMFDYLNIRVYDDEKTDLLKYWDNTFKYINKARNDGSKVLVHCKMGISRSASVVIAYAMKAYNWNFDKALKHVKAKRNCIKPNTNFLNQLETYQGILDAMKNKEKLQRSKSETNLKSPKSATKTESKAMEPTPLVLALTGSWRGRPRSWAPDSRLAADLLPPTSVSLESLAETRHMLMPCAGGSYSVSPNQIIRLKEEGAPSVRHLVQEIETAASGERRDLSRRQHRLNFGTEPVAARPATEGPLYQYLRSLPRYSHTTYLADGIHTWDPGETPHDTRHPQHIVKSDSGIVDVKSRLSETLTNGGDCASEWEGRGAPPSRQSSWSSSDSAVVADLSRRASCRERRRGDNTRKFHEACAVRGSAGGGAAWSGRLSASAPPGAPADTWLRCTALRRRRAAASQPDLRPKPAHHGHVSSLKKEFEARLEGEQVAPRVRAPAPLPPAPSSPPDDVSVRVLVDQYSRGADSKKSRLTEAGGGARARPTLRNSFCGAVRGPPLAPAAPPPHRKQLQHGRTHPLTHLKVDRANGRLSNPVYNTM